MSLSLSRKTNSAVNESGVFWADSNSSNGACCSPGSCFKTNVSSEMCRGGISRAERLEGANAAQSHLEMFFCWIILNSPGGCFFFTILYLGVK